MILYITKYAMTGGIQQRECEISGDLATAKDNRWDYFHREGVEWHRTYEAAAARAEEMRTKKIASLEKQIARIRKLQFRAPTPKD